MPKWSSSPKSNEVGAGDGLPLGASVALAVGAADGASVTTAVGRAVGESQSSSKS